MLMRDRRQPVRFAEIESTDAFREDRDGFDLRRDRGWVWLQKALFAVLGWIGAYRLARYKIFTRTPEQNDSLLKSLLGQEGQWLDDLHFQHARLRIYIGPDEYPELMALSEFRGMRLTTLHGQIETKAGRQHYGEWHNIPITVIPWMIGVLIVKED